MRIVNPAVLRGPPGARRRGMAAPSTVTPLSITDLQVIYAPRPCRPRDAATGEQKALLIRGRAGAGARHLVAEMTASHLYCCSTRWSRILDPDRRNALFNELAKPAQHVWMTAPTRLHSPTRPVLRSFQCRCRPITRRD